MQAQERREIIEVFEKLIKYIEENLDNCTYLCLMKQYIGSFRTCGFNRMIILAHNYLQAQRPTSTKNKKHYNSLSFSRNKHAEPAWWNYQLQPDRVPTNMEKVRFLKHLIQKLKR
jgi:hypothetical protein